MNKMDEIQRIILRCALQSNLRKHERRETYPGSIDREFGRGGFASPLDYDRFLFTLGANRIPPVDSTDAVSDAAIYLRPSSRHPSDSEDDSHQQLTSVPSGGALPAVLDDVWSIPCASLPRDQHAGETEQQEGQQVGRQEGEAATSPVAAPSPVTALVNAFRALQLPSGVPQPLTSSENEDDSHQQTNVPRGALPTDLDDVWSTPYASLPRDQHTDETEQEEGQQEERAATPPVVTPSPETAVISAFGALQLPSGGSQLPESLGNENDSDCQTSVPRDAHATDADDVLSPPSSSLLQTLHDEKEGREEERKPEE
jgi:hypothetical protein